MPFETGNKLGGRPKGSTPKSRAQAEIANFIDEYSGDIKKWMDEVYANEGAKGAFAMFEKLIEYAIPKQSRAEHVGDPDQPIEYSVTVKYVD